MLPNLDQKGSAKPHCANAKKRDTLHYWVFRLASNSRIALFDTDYCIESPCSLCRLTQFSLLSSSQAFSGHKHHTASDEMVENAAPPIIENDLLDHGKPWFNIESPPSLLSH